MGSMETRPARGIRLARLATCVAIWLGLAGCVWLYGPAVELPDDTAEAVERPGIGARALLRAQQSELELASWGPALQASLESLGAGADASRSDAVRAAIRRAYAPQRLFDRMATSVSAAWDPDAARELLEFHGSWLGNRILRAQSTRRDARTLAKFQEWSRGFDLASQPHERVELLRRIDRALLTSQTAVWLNRAMLDAGLGALGESLPPESAGPARALRQRYAGEEPGLYSLAEDQVLRWNLYALRWISSADLERYAQFAESPAAQWWVVSCARAYRVTLTAAGEELFQALRLRGSY